MIRAGLLFVAGGAGARRPRKGFCAGGHGVPGRARLSSVICTKHFPAKWPDTISAAEQTNGISPLHLIGLLATLAKTNELYYLHPSFGYYFEQFCMEPHGLVYKLNTLPNDTLLPPLPDKNLIAANETFWSACGKTRARPGHPGRHAAGSKHARKSIGEKLLKRFHITREPNPNAVIAGIFYSRSLNFWGVQVQRANELTSAAAHFETAQKLNPDNIVAQVNLDFNHSLQAGQTVPVDLAKATADKFGKYRSWNAVMAENGPFDEPSFTFRKRRLPDDKADCRVRPSRPLNASASCCRTIWPRDSGWRNATSPPACPTAP